MNARKIGLLGALATLVASGAYVFVYLYRWEWNRAQVSAAIFIAAEVGAGGLAARRPAPAVERRPRHERRRTRSSAACRPSAAAPRRPG